MARDDWFRNEIWTEEIKEEFFKRWGRCRGHNKSQYLYIQACHLVETGKKKYATAALELLDLMIKSYPDRIHMANAYLHQAKCFEILHKYSEAANSYRGSVKAEHECPNVRVESGLKFGWFVVRYEMEELYDEVLQALESTETNLVFPINQYKYFAIIAIISDSLDDQGYAKRMANNALEAMAKQESPFSYHKKIGLVRCPDKDMVKKLKRLAAV